MQPLTLEEKQGEEKRYVQRMMKKDEQKHIRWAKRMGFQSPLTGIVIK